MAEPIPAKAGESEVVAQAVDWEAVPLDDTRNYWPPAEWPWATRSDVEDPRFMVVGTSRRSLEKIVQDTGGVIAAATLGQDRDDDYDYPDVVWSAAVDLSSQGEGIEVAFPINTERTYTVGTLGSLATGRFFPLDTDIHRDDNKQAPHDPALSVAALSQQFPGAVLLSPPPGAQ